MQIRRIRWPLMRDARRLGAPEAGSGKMKGKGTVRRMDRAAPLGGYVKITPVQGVCCARQRTEPVPARRDRGARRFARAASAGV